MFIKLFTRRTIILAGLTMFLSSLVGIGAIERPSVAAAAPNFVVGVTAQSSELGGVLDRYPQTDISRVFFGKGTTPRWSDSRVQLLQKRGVIPFVSMKDYNLTATRTLVDTLPTNIPRAYLTWHHEPEQDMSGSTFKTQFCNFYRAVKSRPNGSRITVISAQTRQWTENKGNSYATYYPGNSCTDAFGVDAYVNTWQLGSSSSNNYGYPNPDVFLSKMIAFSKQVGKPLFLPELGVARAPGDTTDKARAAWVSAVGSKLKSNGSTGVIYWHTIGKGDVQFKLNQVNGWSDPAVTAWRNVMAL